MDLVGTVPRNLKTVRTILWIQATFTILGSVLVFYSTSVRRGDPTALSVAAGLVSIGIGVVLVVLALRLFTQRTWVRRTAVAVESVIIALQFATLALTFNFWVLIGVVLAAVVIEGVSSKECIAWYAGAPNGRSSWTRGT